MPRPRGFGYAFRTARSRRSSTASPSRPMWTKDALMREVGEEVGDSDAGVTAGPRTVGYRRASLPSRDIGGISRDVLGDPPPPRERGEVRLRRIRIGPSSPYGRLSRACAG